ncbi:MAG TPA: xanthine dehydrogenase family protein molybdopterin-binding subunit [Blastocatellia bacterium]|nr:xanthine dehydrogenase family protein molybdopterin-binding subunit [Blastocatellia bacterium]
MADYKWPEAEKRTHLGKSISRIDGADKVSGRAKYTYDINRPGMLYGKVVRSKYARAKIVSIDTSAAEKMAGVKAVHVIIEPGSEIRWAGEEIVAVAAVDEPTAEDAARAIKIKYEKLAHNVIDTDPKAVGDNARPPSEQTVGDADKAFKEAEVTVEGFYGLTSITHCCLESHGSITEWEGDKNLLVHISTQAVSQIAGQLAGPLETPAGNIRVKQDHIGGGFGSKFGPDRWDITGARLSKKAGGKPVKIMLERDAELMVAGMRPPAYARVKLGAMKDGRVVAWESESWSSGGLGGGGSPPIPYVFVVPNQKRKHTAIATNVGSARAWRAPAHPQACLITMGALEDLAAKLNMDPYDLFLKNIDLTGARADVYREEMKIAADLIGWKAKWHPRGDKNAGPVKRGLGLSIHTWGGGGHASDCDITIQPDGSVEVKMGTQDLGVGTRTALRIVAADTFAIPLDSVNVLIGDNRYPASGGSGGSTTIGGISASTRRGSLDALDALFAKVAPSLGAQPADLEAFQGTIRVKSDPSKSVTWKQACAKIGATPITVRGKNPGPGTLTSSGVGGVQMADVSVDVETGIVKINKIVAVQDCGLVVNKKLAESQCYGALIMGVAYSLYEEKVMDVKTGRMLNPNMEFYKLAGIADIGELVVHMMTGKGYDERGVIGLGEPPVVSPGAVISNAVANAIGVRVPTLPLTPDRVLEALEKKGGTNNASI